MQFDKIIDPIDEFTRDYLIRLRAGAASPETDYKFKTKPKRHQRVIFEYIRYLKNLFLHGEQGIGKTKSVIDPLDHMAERVGLQRVLVVCPNSVKRSWRSEIEKHSRIYDAGSVFIIPDQKRKRDKLLEDFPAGIYIVNYEKVRSLKASGQALSLLNWDWVIADEASKIKNRQSKQSKAMHDFADVCGMARRIAMTGTPVTKSPMDLFSIFRFLDPTIFGRKWMEFAHRYAQMTLRQIPKKKPFWQVDGYQNLGELTRRAYAVGVQYMKTDCLDLEPKTYVNRYSAMPPVVRKVYNSLRDKLVAEIEIEGSDSLSISAPNILAKMGKLRQITSGFVYEGQGDVRRVIELAAKPKLDDLISMLDEIPGQFLVWCLFREDVDAVTKALRKQSVNADCIHGGVDLEQRQVIVEQFQRGDKDALVLQTSACAYGLTLTAADTAIVYSRNADLDHRLQMADRIHRMGQTRPVTIIDLLAEETIDEFDMDLMARKLRLSTAVTTFELKELFLKHFKPSMKGGKHG